MNIKFNRQSIFWPALILAFAGVVLFWLYQNHEARMVSKIKAPEHQELVKNSHDQQLQKFRLTGFDEKGKTFWNLEGDAAKIDPSQTVFLDQNVTLKLRDNTVVKTDHVQWSQSNGLLKTNSLVFVDHQNTKIKGVGAVGKPGESFIQLNRNVEMIINRTTRLVCDGPMKVFYKNNQLIFYRNVRVTDERGVLKANRMDVYFDPNQRKVTQIVAIGNVVIERGTDTTHSRRCIYTLATGSIRLEGNPEITLHKESTALLDGPFRN